MDHFQIESPSWIYAKEAGKFYPRILCELEDNGKDLPKLSNSCGLFVITSGWFPSSANDERGLWTTLLDFIRTCTKTRNYGSLLPSQSMVILMNIVSSLIYPLDSTSSCLANFAPPKLAFFSSLGRPKKGSFSWHGFGLMLNLMCFLDEESSCWSSK